MAKTRDGNEATAQREVSRVCHAAPWRSKQGSDTVLWRHDIETPNPNPQPLNPKPWCGDPASEYSLRAIKLVQDRS